MLNFFAEKSFFKWHVIPVTLSEVRLTSIAIFNIDLCASHWLYIFIFWHFTSGCKLSVSLRQQYSVWQCIETYCRRMCMQYDCTEIVIPKYLITYYIHRLDDLNCTHITISNASALSLWTIYLYYVWLTVKNEPKITRSIQKPQWNLFHFPLQ